VRVLRLLSSSAAGNDIISNLPGQSYLTESNSKIDPSFHRFQVKKKTKLKKQNKDPFLKQYFYLIDPIVGFSITILISHS